MYLRTRKNKSGSTSVFVVASKRFKNKKHPRSIVVKSFGSSNDPKEIALLCEKGRKFASENSYTSFLRINNENDIENCKVKTIGFEHFYGEFFKRYFTTKLFKNINNQILKNLVLMRVAQPVSKLKTSTIASDYNCSGLTINKIYKFMDTLNSTNIANIKKHVFSHTKKLLGHKSINVLFYDLTTIYFENNNISDLKNFGFSKDGKSQHVQINLVLIVTEHGLPIGYEIFPGNFYEGKTLLPVLLDLRKNYNINNVTVVADSALLSAYNLKLLAENNFNYIVAARIKNLNKKLKQQVLTSEQYLPLNDDIKYKVIPLDSISLISCYSKNRAEKDNSERELTLQRIKKFLGKSAKDKLKGILKKPYIKLSKQSTIMLDESKLIDCKELDGYFGFYTNTKNDPKSVIDQYKGLWQVEQTFRITKHNLAIRPVYHYRDRRITAHFAICFLALSLIRTVEYFLKKNHQEISIEHLHQALIQIKSVQINNKNQAFNIISDLPDNISYLYQLFNITKPKKFSSIPNY